MYFYNSIGRVLDLIFASSRLTEGTAACPSPLLIITQRERERERERLIKRYILSMFMVGSKILRFMMSPFYVRVAKAHAYLERERERERERETN